MAHVGEKLMEERTRLSYIVNTVAVDDLAKEGAVVLAYSSRNIQGQHKKSYMFWSLWYSMRAYVWFA